MYPLDPDRIHPSTSWWIARIRIRIRIRGRMQIPDLDPAGQIDLHVIADILYICGPARTPMPCEHGLYCGYGQELPRRIGEVSECTVTSE